jgi:uncharacterized protein (TIGR00299 family) protein
MFLGACIDLGMPLDVVAEAVERLGLAGVSVEARRARRGGFAGTRFRVLLDGRPVEGPDPEETAEGHDPAAGHDPAGEPAHGHDHHDPGHHDHHHGHGHPHHHHHAETHPGAPQRTLPAIRRLISDSALDPAVKATALRLFERLGEAEAGVHGVPVDEVHFHEVGAVDSIVDLVGAAAAVHHLAPARLSCGPVNVGGGAVDTEHGRLPVPSPATAGLLAAAGVPVYGGPGGELLTPTGAVLLAELVDGFGPLPALTLEGVGYGLGRKEVPGRPNAARLLRGRPPAGEEAAEGVMVVETEIDDLPGEGFGFLMERLLAEGALDVYFTPVQMKKSRPGTLVTLLCRRPRLEPLAATLIAESGSLGCRFHPAGRIEAERTTVEVDTRFGRVRVKRARLGDRRVADAPEFEDCRRLALEAGVPWREVWLAALAALGG